MRREWSVIVGNIGTVYHGHSESKARTTYLNYVHQSQAAYGRASGEPVTLLRDGEPVKEYAYGDPWAGMEV